MELNRAIGLVSNHLANYDVRFVCLDFNGSNYEYIASLKDMVFAWKHNDTNVLMPENGSIIHGLMFVDHEGDVIMVNTQDMIGLTFDDLMNMILGRTIH